MRKQKSRLISIMMAVVILFSVTLPAAATAATLEEEAFKNGQAITKTLTVTMSEEALRKLGAQYPKDYADTINQLKIKTYASNTGDEYREYIDLLLEDEVFFGMDSMLSEQGIYQKLNFYDDVMGFTREELGAFGSMIYGLLIENVMAMYDYDSETQALLLDEEVIAQQETVKQELQEALLTLYDMTDEMRRGEYDKSNYLLEKGSDEYYQNFYNSFAQTIAGGMPEEKVRASIDSLIALLAQWHGDISSEPQRSYAPKYQSSLSNQASLVEIYEITHTDLTKLIGAISQWAYKDENIDLIFAIIEASAQSEGISLITELEAQREELRAAVLSLPMLFALQAASYIGDPITIAVHKDANNNIVSWQCEGVFYPEGLEGSEGSEGLEGLEGKAPFEIVLAYYTKDELNGVRKRLVLEGIYEGMSVNMSAQILKGTPYEQNGKTITDNDASFRLLTMENGFVTNVAIASFVMNSQSNAISETQAINLNITYLQALIAETFVFDITSEKKLDKAADGMLAGQQSITAYITEIGETTPIIEIVIDTASGQPEAFVYNESDVVRPGKMTPEGLYNWEVNTFMPALQQYINGLMTTPVQ